MIYKLAITEVYLFTYIIIIIALILTLMTKYWPYATRFRNCEGY